VPVCVLVGNGGGELHDVELLILMGRSIGPESGVFDESGVSYLEDLDQNKYLWIGQIDLVASRHTACQFANDVVTLEGAMIADMQFNLVL
jgi:hypothetical protein